MGSLPVCDLCESEPAAVMQSSLADGQTVAIGLNCALPFYLTTITAILDTMPAEAVAEYGLSLKPVLDKFGYRPEPAPPETRAGRKLRKVAATPAGPAGTEGENGEAQPASAGT